MGSQFPGTGGGGGAPSGAAGGDLAGSTYPNPVIAASAITSAKIANGAILDADVNTAAAVAESKLALAFGTSTLNTAITNEVVRASAAEALLTPLTDLRLFTPSLPRPLDQPQTILTQFQSGHGFTKAAGTGSQTDDSTDFVDGTQSLKIVTLGDSSAYITQKSSISPTINATGMQLRIVFWVTSITNVADLSIYLSSDNGATNNYHQSILTIINAVTQPYCQDGERVEYVLNWCDLDSTGSPNRAAINFLKLRVADKNGIGVTAHFQSIALEPEP